MRYYTLLFVLLSPFFLWSQSNQDDALLSVILRHYYKNEKVVIKNRSSQFLFLLCDKANNNEAIFETVNTLALPPESLQDIKRQIDDKSVQHWGNSLEQFYGQVSPFWKSKINDCFSLDDFQKMQQSSNLSNQRLLIIYKPLYIKNSNRALVKIVFYRTNEHNSGTVLHLEKTKAGWKIIEQLNTWST